MNPTALRTVVTGIGAVVFLYLGVEMTIETYHPLPPGKKPIDGRGLFAPVLITALTSIGGVLAYLSAEPSVPFDRPIVSATLGGSIAVGLFTTVPVVYMLFFTGPTVSSELESYRDWYTIPALAAVIPVSYRLFRRGLRSALDEG